MGAFKIEIVGVGGHGCDRKAKTGEKIYGRCGRFGCPDCEAYNFVQQLRQKGMLSEGQAYSVPVDPADVERLRSEGVDVHEEQKYEQNPVTKGYEPVGGTGKFWRAVPKSATFTHWPESNNQVVDDLLSNERKVGAF